MAKNREHQKPVELQSESGEEEESGDEASSEEVNSQDSESEREQNQVTKKGFTPPTQKQTPATKPAPHKNIQLQAPPKGRPPPSSSSGEEEEESGSESGSDSDEPETNVRSMSSAPGDHQKSDTGPRKPKVKAPAAEVATPTTVTKRPSEDKEKPAKKNPDTPVLKPNTDEAKRLLFQRLWSEDDEIVILEGMIEYSSEMKLDPVADLTAFHNFIRNNLHVDVTRTQLQDKIRRLKKKYENNKSKEKAGKDRNFTKPHEQKAYNLSKLVWGGVAGKKDNGVGHRVIGSPRSNDTAVRKSSSKRTASAVENEEIKNSSALVSVEGEKSARKELSVSGSCVEERILRTGTELFEVGNGIEGEKEWKKLKVEEIELFVKQMEVKVAQSKLVLDALKSTDV